MTVRNCTRDEGRPFEIGNQVLSQATDYGQNARFGINFRFVFLALGVVAIHVLTEATK
jgi:hypothetical protein